jgi:crotonobetainyl-CoA:carnitine CoA-transferase CaiB-like acyl-CoA transferase
VVLTNFKPGTLDKLGLGYETLAELNPGIILSESSAFGNHGPWSGRMGYGPLVRASAGLSMLWQYPDIPESFSDAITIYPDHVGARLNAVAVSALLLRRQRTGKGGRVGSAQVDIIFGGMADQLALESVKPNSIRPEGNDRGEDAPRGVFRASGEDNWVVIDVVAGSHFAGLARTIGHPEWLTEPDLGTASGRLKRKDELSSAVQAWTAERTAESAAAELQQAGVPAGQMARMADLEQDLHLKQRNLIGALTHQAFPTPLPTLLAEAHFESVPSPRLAPAPYQGEHTRSLAGWHLGMDETEIQRLLDENILQEFAGTK